MRRILTISRCKCPRCTAARRVRFFVVLGICIALVATDKHPIIRPCPVPPNYVNMTASTGEAPEPPFSETTSAVHSLPMIKPPTSATAENSRLFTAKRYLQDARIPRELENAALAAGLVDSSSISVIAPALSSVTTLTKPISASIATAPVPNETASMPPRRSAETESVESMPAFSSRTNYGRGSRAAMKQASLRLVGRTGIGGPGNTPLEERKSPADSPRNENKSEPPTGQRTRDLAQPPQILSGDLQRFVSDFVRTDQSNSVADQHRFFADSVHFYGEGDLSWASVAAATRRYHQQRQTRRSEIAEPAATKGPVNGGFYVIEQPVVWTRAQGSQLTRGRSVLRLRVLPIDHGGWKITSIEEINR